MYPVICAGKNIPVVVTCCEVTFSVVTPSHKSLNEKAFDCLHVPIALIYKEPDLVYKTI